MAIDSRRADNGAVFGKSDCSSGGDDYDYFDDFDDLNDFDDLGGIDDFDDFDEEFKYDRHKSHDPCHNREQRESVPSYHRDTAYSARQSYPSVNPRSSAERSGGQSVQWDWGEETSRQSSVSVSRKRLPVAALAAIDILLIGCSLLVFALFHHVLPKEYASVNNDFSAFDDASAPSSIENGVTDVASATDAVSGSDAESTQESELQPPYTEEIIVTDTSYSSPNVAVSISTSDAFGSTYYVQDIHIKNISSFRTALAEDKYGKSIYENIPDMAERNNAICTVNGDYYAMHSTKGIVIRNGTFYRGNGTEDDDILVLYADGTMETFTMATYNEGLLLQRNDIWQAWSFGPSLLNDDGNAIDEFDSEVKGPNPRTVVGYYEPGHYCFVCVDGRSDQSKGMTLVELAQLMESLGCKLAFNLDGGQTSMMLFGDQLVNNPYKGGRKCSDILYICEPENQ